MDTDAGDGFRESGFSKERRLEPRITIGLLTDAAGFPLMVNAFEGNAAETNPKHALKRLDGANSEGCSGLPEIVRRQRRQAHAFNGHRRPGSSAERIVRSGLVDRLPATLWADDSAQSSSGPPATSPGSRGSRPASAPPRAARGSPIP